MYQEAIPTTNGSFDRPAANSPLRERRIEALRALANLLLKEVESLGEISSHDVITQEAGKIDLSDEVQRFEIELIRRALLQAKGNQRNAALLLGTKATTLHAKIKKYGWENFSSIRKL